MNVSSASLTPASLFAKDSAISNAGSATPKSPLASLLDNKTSSSISSASESDKGSAPGLDVAKKLKALGEQFLAVMLITDPVERARAAKDLYKQYAQTAKEYAGATADGRAAAEAATQMYAANPASIADGGKSADDASETPGTAATPIDPAAADAADPAEPNAAAPATVAAPAQPAVTYVAGKKSNFAADLYMEQIKTFANAAQQVYQSATEEARRKHADKNKLHGFADEMKDARDTLTEAAKAVEGPAATAEGYDPTAMAVSSSAPATPSILNVTA